MTDDRQSMITDHDILEIAGLIYRRWSDAFATLEAVKKEKNNGDPDWDLFHEARFESAKAEEWEWNDRKARFLAENKSIFDRMF